MTVIFISSTCVARESCPFFFTSTQLIRKIKEKSQKNTFYYTLYIIDVPVQHSTFSFIFLCNHLQNLFFVTTWRMFNGMQKSETYESAGTHHNRRQMLKPFIEIIKLFGLFNYLPWTWSKIFQIPSHEVVLLVVTRLRFERVLKECLRLFCRARTKPKKKENNCNSNVDSLESI